MSNPYILSIATTTATLLAVLSLTPVTADGQAPADNTAKVTPAVKGGPFPRQLTVYDRQGNVLRTLGEPGRYYSPVLSPDATRLAALEIGQDRQTIWVFDLSTGTRTGVTSVTCTSPCNLFPQGYTSGGPVWSPDGSQIAYWSWREGYGGLYRKASNGTGSEELLYKHTLGVDIPLTDWSPDGRFLSFSAGDVLWVMPVNGERKALELAREEFSFFGARLGTVHGSPPVKRGSGRGRRSGLRTAGRWPTWLCAAAISVCTEKRRTEREPRNSCTSIPAGGWTSGTGRWTDVS